MGWLILIIIMTRLIRHLIVNLIQSDRIIILKFHKSFWNHLLVHLNKICNKKWMRFSIKHKIHREDRIKIILIIIWIIISTNRNSFKLMIIGNLIKNNLLLKLLIKRLLLINQYLFNFKIKKLLLLMIINNNNSNKNNKLFINQLLKEVQGIQIVHEYLVKNLIME